jgi:hypothetical protein
LNAFTIAAIFDRLQFVAVRKQIAAINGQGFVNSY